MQDILHLLQDDLGPDPDIHSRSTLPPPIPSALLLCDPCRFFDLSELWQACFMASKMLTCLVGRVRRS